MVWLRADARTTSRLSCCRPSTRDWCQMSVLPRRRDKAETVNRCAEHLSKSLHHRASIFCAPMLQPKEPELRARSGLNDHRRKASHSLGGRSVTSRSGSAQQLMSGHQAFSSLPCDSGSRASRFASMRDSTTLDTESRPPSRSALVCAARRSNR